ncbi:pyrroloquinoline quinone-dependent dehydrogenase [Granulicella sp. WH15]|uniref:pyrroloquinoline quinone-dependent dehydrogenase n=1 Tax=Granulicella sp. WH15 TaxID=2602070 RepID=UPI0013A52C4A|nr:pyrroloquinoline quinone-dependent dehydrogenase [Granulicella sp. WH15]
MRSFCFCAVALSTMASVANCQSPASAQTDWPFYGGDQGGMKYSTLTAINKQNVSRLHVAWTWKTGETEMPRFGSKPGMFEVTPLMIDGVLYLSTPYSKVVALKAATGELLWSYDPKAYELGQPANGTGWVHRGVAAWRDGGKLRIFINSRYRLICLDAATGKPVPTFGKDGVIDLSEGLVWPINKLHYTETSPPVVYKDIVILGNGVGDRLVYRNDPPGGVRGFDARTGRQLWSFHTIPQAGEPGNESWGKDAWKFTGHTNVWAPMTLDAARGLLYLPVSTPSNDFFGGNRPGNNLYGESLVCLDAATGIKKWHYQIVHHGLWDYDLASPPTLVTIKANGHKLDAVAQATKEGFVFVFDRVSGKPVWPIEERPVPASDVPNEHASPTQPFPSKPPAISPQGVTPDLAFDATPELKAEALEAMKSFRTGPLFTPPSYKGTLMLPGVLGGGNWGGGAFDPESGLLFVKTTNMAHVARIKQPDKTQANPHASEVDADWAGDLAGTNATFHNGLPLTKPPYGQLTAIDLNQGTIRWQIPFGDWPELRQNPALANVKLPEVLGVAGPAGTIVTKAGLVFVGGGDRALHAYDEATGKELWRGALPSASHGTPMTYRSQEGKQYVVIASGIGSGATLVAFALDENTADK